MSPLDFIRSHADIFARCGSVVASYRTTSGRRCGPYYHLAYRSGGRQRSLYLGASEELVAQVRSLLTELQARRNYYRMVAQSERLRRENLLRIKRQWQQAALAHGLYARGWELRGWRPPSLPRLSLPRVSLTLPLPSVPYRFYTNILRPIIAAPICAGVPPSGGLCPIPATPPPIPETRITSEAAEPSTEEARSVSEAAESSTTETRRVSEAAEPATKETRSVSEAEESSTPEIRRASEATEPSTEETRRVNEAATPATPETRSVSESASPAPPAPPPEDLAPPTLGPTLAEGHPHRSLGHPPQESLANVISLAEGHIHPPATITEPHHSPPPAPKGHPHITPGAPFQATFTLIGPGNKCHSPSPIPMPPPRQARIWQNRPSVDQNSFALQKPPDHPPSGSSYRPSPALTPDSCRPPPFTPVLRSLLSLTSDPLPL